MKVVHEAPQITQVIAKALRYLQELEDNILLLKTGHTSNTGLGAMEQGLIGKPSTCSLAFIVLDDNMQKKK